LIGKPERMKLPGRYKDTYYNNKMDLRETDWDGMDWINLAIVNTVMNLQVP
jgi:hypothetical protein